MRIEADRKLDFDDVLIRPKRSGLKSRAEVDLRRTFKTPLVPWIPLAGIGFSLWLLSKLPAIAWERFVVWMGLGLLLYFSYGRRHSVLAKIGEDFV